jgi:hypothetical protein
VEYIFSKENLFCNTFFQMKKWEKPHFFELKPKRFFASQKIKFTNGQVTNRQGRPGRFKKEIMKID